MFYIYLDFFYRHLQNLTSIFICVTVKSLACVLNVMCCTDTDQETASGRSNGAGSAQLCAASKAGGGCAAASSAVCNDVTAVKSSMHLFTSSTKSIVWGLQSRAVQGMLDFDYVCSRRSPSVVAMVYPLV